MARTRSFDDAQTTAAAMHQFWKHGYADTSLADLERCTGLNRSSIYQLYGSKRGLFDAAVQIYLREVFTPRLAVLAGPGPGLARIEKYFHQLETTLKTLPADLMKRGCLVVNSATELADHDSGIRQVVQEYRRALSDAFSAALAESAGFAESAGSAVSAVSTVLSGPEKDDPERDDPERNVPERDVRRRTDILVAGVIGVLVTSRFDLALAGRTAAGLAAEVHSWQD